MASFAGLTLREAILPLYSTFAPEKLRTVKIENTWGNNAQHYYKMYLPVCGDPSDKEAFLYVIEQFVDAAHNDRLHLSTGDARYSKFRQVLDGALRLEWQTISDARNNKTVDSFIEDVHALIALHFASTAREDQLAYLRSTTKKFDHEVSDVSARLTVMDKLGRWLPGSWTPNDHTMHNLFSDDHDKKRQLFSVMPMKYRIAVAQTGRSLDDATFTYAQLTHALQLQEAIERQERGRKRSRGEQPVASRGRGRGTRGYGRGHGRAYYERNQGRGSGRGYAYGRGYYGNPNRYAGAATTNPFVAGAQGGRIPQQQPYTPRTPRPYQAQRNPVPRVSHSVSPRRPMVRGRGPGPQLPQFMADDNYHQEGPHVVPPAAAASPAAAAPQDHYYEGEGYDNYYGDDQDHYYGDEYGGEDHYYQGDEYQGDEHYYGDEQGGGGDDQAEDHFLQDFGY